MDELTHVVSKDLALGNWIVLVDKSVAGARMEPRLRDLGTVLSIRTLLPCFEEGIGLEAFLEG